MSRYYDWRPYVSAAERRRNAEHEVAKLRKKGHTLSPVTVEGRAIARTFWGKSWCQNLERYSDYENRLPRGRTYVRNGSVLDLQIAPGEVAALVSGSEVYRVAVEVAAVPKALWKALCTDCAGAIDSLVELLRGRFSEAVMERLCRQKTGLFPSPAEIKFSCSCPDWAGMCKHVAAVLYGVGARLDGEPDLLFKLRKVDEADLLAHAGTAVPLGAKGPAAGRVLEDQGLADLFGVELGGGEEVPTAKAPARRGRAKVNAVTAAAPLKPEKPAKVRAAAKPGAKPAVKRSTSQEKPVDRLAAARKPKAKPMQKPTKAPAPSAAPRAPGTPAALDPASPLAEIYERLLKQQAEGRCSKPWKRTRRR